MLKKKSKAILVTGRGGLQSCEMLRIPHYLDDQLTDGGKVVRPYAPAALYSPETLFACFWYSFLLKDVKIVGPSVAGRIR
jgi:hypothetical protein